jgi:NSS family neurotransmitter:Na+ symporter
LKLGAITGIVYYLYPDFSLLLSGKIWLAAAGQIFFSLGVASGVMTAYVHISISNSIDLVHLTNLIKMSLKII